MLEKAAETAKKSEADDVENCLRLCHDLERQLSDKLGSRSGADGSEPDSPVAATEDGGTAANGMLREDAGLDGAAKKRAGKAEDEEERRERENELRLQLALADEESKILRRKLTEMRGDNENLMRAVEYLRKKLEQRDASNSPPTKHRDQISTAEAQGARARNSTERTERDNQMNADSKTEVNPGEIQKSSELAFGDSPTDRRYLGNSRSNSSSYEDDEKRTRSEDGAENKLERLQSDDEGRKMKARTPSTSSEEDRQNRDGGGAGSGGRERDDSLVIKWKNRTMELQNEIGMTLMDCHSDSVCLSV